MMDPISNLSQLIETMRRQMSPHLDRPNTPATRTAKDGSALTQQNERAGLSELQPTLAQRIKAIDPDDKRRRQKATRIFLETVLVNEFGDAFLADPRFTEIVAEIQVAMEADEQIRDQLDALVTHLSK